MKEYIIGIIAIFLTLTAMIYVIYNYGYFSLDAPLDNILIMIRDLMK